MSIHRQKYFHLSQVTVPRNTVHPTHHRPLSLFLVFLMLAQQVGILGTSAGSTGVGSLDINNKAEYIYVQTNPVIDDSWIGTRVNEKNTILNAAPNNKPSIYTINAGTYQVSDGTWIFPKKPTKNTNSTEQNTEFNSAPLVPVAQIPMSGFSTAPLVTPNGTPFASIGGYVSSSSSSALVNNGIISGDQSVSGNSLIAGNQTISGSLTVSGTTTLSNIVTQNAQIDTLTLGGGTGTPTEILGRDASGSVNGVGVGPGLSLSGGVLSIVSAVLSVTTDGVSEGLTNLYFTDLRAQNALSGTIATINTSLSGVTADISTIFSDISSLSGNLATTNANLATTNSNLLTLSGNLFTTNSNLLTLSGNLATTNGNLALLTSDVSTISGSLATTISNLSTTNSNLTTAIGNITSLSGSLATLTSTVGTLGTNLTSLSGVVAGNTSAIATNAGNITTLSGLLSTTNSNLATTNSNLLTLSGNLATTNSNLSTLTTNFNSLSGTVATLLGASHDALTLATTNGLSLVGQQLSLALASSTTTGALSQVDWNTFNNKINLTSLSAGSGITYNNTTGLFGWNGTTSNVAEGSNLYYTTARFNTDFAARSTTNLTEGTNLYYTTTRANTDFDTRLATKSTTDLTEGTNLYFTNARARTALSITGPLTYDNVTGVFGINQSNTTTNGFLSSTDWNTFNNKIGTIGTANGLSIAGTGISLALASSTTTGALSQVDWNTFNSKENVLTFGTGLIRVGNTVGIGTLTGGMLSGFTNGQLVFGSPTGGLTQSGGLFWNNTTGRLGVGTAVPAQLLDVAGTLQSSRYLLDLDLSLIPIANNQSALTSWWGLQLVGNRQANVDYTPIAYGLQDDYGVLIPNQQATKVALMVRGAAGQSGHLTRWENSAGTTLSVMNATGALGLGISTPTAKLHVVDNTITTGNLVTLVSTGTTTGNLLQLVGSGSRSLLRVAQNGADPLDIERVTIGQGGISATKPDAIGTRDQLYVFGRINSSWDMAWYDFLGGTPANIAADTNLSDGIAYDPIAGATFSLASLAGYSGIGQISLTAVNNNAGFLGSAGVTPTERSLNPVFETRLMVSANTTVRMVAGFADRVLNAGITADANNYNNEAFFRKIAGGTTWTAVTRSAAGAETVTPLTNLVTTMSILRIEIDNSGAGAVRFYIDGTLVATHTGASIPAAATRLGYHVGIHNTAAAAKILYVDYLRVWSDDPPMSGTTIESFLASSPILASGSIANTYSSKGFLQEVDALLDTTSSRTLSGDIIFTEKGEYSTEEYAEHVLNFTKKSLEKMSGTKIVSDLAFRTLSADKICIAGTCYTSGALVTHDSLQAILGTQTQSTTYSTTIIESSDDTGILDSFIKTLEKLFVQIETVFNEIVTFVKSVTFQSDVTFEERVIFEDHDMAGTAIILAGDSSVRVDFARPYATIPVVTVSADAFVTYRVTDKGVTGFTIETQNNVSSDTRFDWIALMVTGSSVTSSASSSGELVPVEPIPTEVTPEEVTEEVPEEVIPPVVSEVTEESAPEVTPEESVTEEVTENVPTEEVIDEVTTETTTDVATLDIPVEDSITVEDTPTEITPEAPVEVPTVSGE